MTTTHTSTGYRIEHGTKPSQSRLIASCSCGAEHREDGTNGTILTVHHPDRDPSNRDARLTVLCARCHLAVEGMARARQRWVETGNRQQIAPGQEAMQL